MSRATPKQKAMFFALAHQLGYPAELVKERAKSHFGLESFNDISAEQLRELIDRLVRLQEQRKEQAGKSSL